MHRRVARHWLFRQTTNHKSEETTPPSKGGRGSLGAESHPAQDPSTCALCHRTNNYK
ncbi:hypothetical protein H1P_2230013 [Hyella patelloides LEGE 07179]|uniref:Uncharacterized protein n=1 Tax=Hyella patelloides LEGE 07179 TaxID=945734 RepID=A0A563VRG9_9CYAN|nr:hypothetical protein H1P_2230013 [Hyella patelloides LEGE 07179]